MFGIPLFTYNGSLEVIDESIPLSKDGVECNYEERWRRQNDI